MTTNTGTGAARLSPKEALTRMAANRTSTTPIAKTSKPITTPQTADPNIQTNTFFKIIFNPALTPEQKKEEVAKALTFEGTKQENATRLKEFDKFKEYLQFKRQEMADEFMRLADTEAFSELKDVIDQMNQGLLDFDREMKPLLDILDAVYRLRTGGENGENLVLTAFKEIQDEKAKEADRQRRMEEKARLLTGIDQENRRTLQTIAAKREEKRWWGLMGPSKKTLQEAAGLQELVRQKGKDAEAIKGELQAIKDEIGLASTLSEEHQQAKKGLKDLLDISSAEHTERQQRLINTARRFVDTSRTRTQSVLGHLEGIDVHVGKIFDANGKIRNAYAIIHDASKDATKNNSVIHESIRDKEKSPDLSEIAKQDLEDQRGAVETHVQALDITTRDTAATLLDLSAQRGQIGTMKDRNQQQIARTRSLMTSGVAGVADRLVVVTNGISMAALTESTEAAGHSLKEMDKKTRDVTGQEVIQKVLGVQTENDRLTEALKEFGEFGETLRTGTALYRQEVEKSLGIVSELKEAADKLKQDVEEAASVHADMHHENPGAPANQNAKTSAPAAPKVEDPFGLTGGPG